MHSGNIPSRRQKVQAKVISASSITPHSCVLDGDANLNPLGDSAPLSSLPNGFDPQAILAATTEAIPAWQRDSGQNIATGQAALLERQSILKALTRLDRFGVIFDKSGCVIQGNPGWTVHLAGIATLSVIRKRFAPVSLLSQHDFFAGLNLLFDDFKLPSIPIALRDLDGWVCDVIHIKRVGIANPDLAYALLPKSPADLAATLISVSRVLALTPLETTLLGLIVKGDTNLEIATTVRLKQSATKAAIRQLVGKFQVRRKSDIVRLLASFP